MHEPPLVLVLESDLWFLSRIRAAAAGLGARVESVRRADQLAARVAQARPALVLLNIGAAESDWAAAITLVKADAATRATPIVAYGPHVDTAAQTQARAAGADRVLSNQRFTETLPDLLARYLSPPA